MEISRFIGHLGWKITANTPKPSADTLHTVVFAIKQTAIDILEDKLLEISDPKNKKYGKFLSREDVGRLSSNLNSTNSVLSTLRSIKGVTVSRVAVYGEYISAKATIKTWEELFQSIFYSFTFEGKSAARMPEYRLPHSLEKHVEEAFNVIDMPFFFPAKKFSHEIRDSSVSLHPYSQILRPESSTPYTIIDTNTVYANPSFINTLYNISSNNGSSKASQLIYSSLGQIFSKADLRSFQESFGLPFTQPTIVGGETVITGKCQDTADCMEVNTDVAWMTALSQKAPTTVFYDSSEEFIGWIQTMANYVNPPLVISISYGAYEGYYSTSQLRTWNTEAIKLGLQGVTIIAASGDWGVTGALNTLQACGYGPLFPSSSPFVTTVGATQGSVSTVHGKQVVREVSCQNNIGGLITTGGGFSNAYPMPSWQKSAVDQYFQSLPKLPYVDFAGHPPLTEGKYNSIGRAYPDVSAWGAFVYIYIGGTMHLSAGTSVSAPIFAAMVSLVNAERLEKGLPPVGWLNPFLYSSGKSFVTDITSGSNNCLGGETQTICCQHGFQAAVGWDPVTGLGTINFGKFRSAAIQLAPQQASAYYAVAGTITRVSGSSQILSLHSMNIQILMCVSLLFFAINCS